MTNRNCSLVALLAISASFVAQSSAAKTSPRFPAEFVGRWEENLEDCKTSIDLRDDSGWLIAKPKEIEFFEGATERLLTIRPIGPHSYRVQVLASEFEGKHEETYDFAIKNNGRSLVMRYRSGPVLLHRCDQNMSSANAHH